MEESRSPEPAAQRPSSLIRTPLVSRGLIKLQEMGSRFDSAFLATADVTSHHQALTNRTTQRQPDQIRAHRALHRIPREKAGLRSQLNIGTKQPAPQIQSLSPDPGVLRA
ncbi:hypothetical protein SKAU_G00141700 [Synaphobranchus kaupii]|uniref:Uncharacterized protein n=1 Tax=Synaphobranchus kaupii TaxID=118154 RepID=A0A9Q1FSW3_SYNKA|nr:hypothetical protein SKAU_G00141700 [Synaphobranchus kaupii]